MTDTIKIKKRNGTSEQYNVNKIHKVLEWATEDIEDVSISEIEIKSNMEIASGMSTKDIHNTLISTASKLISEEYPNYQYVAARLALFQLRKDVYKQFEPFHLLDIINSNVKLKKYDSSILEAYSKHEIEVLNNYIKHDRDFKFTYIGINQLIQKYLVKDRVTKKIYETPQIAFMLISMFGFAQYEKEIRMKYVKEFYDLLSNFDISLPTPIMAGLRTITKQFSSCVLLDTDDSLNSIIATTGSIIKYVSQKAGLGINVGKIRALNSSIRNGDAYHTGIIPFIQMFEKAVGSCSQGGVRKGSATLYYPIWHLEIEDLIVLKNNKGTEENRARNLDYSIQFNKLFYERIIKKEKITLFSPSDTPGLYEAFFKDQNLFKELYEKYEKDSKIRKKQIDANELFSNIIIERNNTGRIYLMNVDHSNINGPFKEDKAPVYISNLCSEILLPTVALNSLEDETGEIPLCTLSAVNLGTLKHLSQLENRTELLTRFLDSILTYQEYPVLAAKKSTEKYRPLGIGVINFAYYLAKNNVKYTDAKALEMTHQLFEALQYYSLQASNKLAKEFGKFSGFENSKYSEGSLGIDRYKKDLDQFANFEYLLDWNKLREEIKQTGLRNATLTAIMPAETSAMTSNSTNGIEPIRDYIVNKTSKD